MKFVLLPGRETVAVYGRKVDLFLFGMDRHAWGTIHFIIAGVFLALLITHIILHWKMIVVLYQSLIGNKIARSIVAIIIAIVGISCIVFPLIIKPEIKESGRKGGPHHKDAIYESK